MKFHWLLSGFFSIFLFCSPVKAGKIIDWEFESQDNSLVFTTDEGVQPEAQLLNNPTRLVIDLPGTVLGRETIKETYRGTVRGFRIGQPEPNKSRIVVELAPGYTLDPDRIKFKGVSPTEWEVEIPEPKVSRIDIADSEDSIELDLPQVDLPDSLPGLEDAELPTTTTTVSLDNSPHVRATKNGFFVAIDGNRQIKIDSERDGNRIDFILEGIALPDDLVDRSLEVDQHGVERIEFQQVNDSEALMSVTVNESSPDWLATFSRIKGLLLVPKGKLPTSTTVATSPSEPPAESMGEIKPREEDGELGLIEAIELTDNDGKIVVRADNELAAVASRSSNGIYNITVDNAELADDFRGPELVAGSPISQLKVRQEGERVVIEVTTRLRYSLGQIEAEDDAVALPIKVGVAPPPQADTPLVPPSLGKLPKTRPTLTNPTPPPKSDRPRIIIDPGHGGHDPGTVGIGGFREKDVVLPISLDVAEILRKQGVEVIMTRDTDRFITLEGRTDLSNDLNADLFVSIHANAINLSRPDVNGLETYYYKSGRRLAEIIHWSILNGVNIDNRGIRRARFYVLRHSIAPAVLVEVGFLTGEVDASRLKNPNHRRQMAEAIARGIIEYIKQNNL